MALVAAEVVASCSGGAKPRTSTLDLPPAQVSGTRLRARYLEAPGGLRIPVGWKDVELGTPCRLQAVGGGEIRCVPDPVLSFADSVTLYGDAACSATVADIAPFCAGAYGDPPAFIADATLTPTRYLPVMGKLAAGAQAYILKPDCIPSRALAQGYAVGPASPLTMFAGAISADTIPPGRLRPTSLVTDDGAAELLGIADTSLGLPCSPEVAGDGVLRCLPPSTTLAYLYADPGCKMAAVAAPPGVLGLEGLAFSVGDGSCPGKRIYMLTGPVRSLSTVYWWQKGACTASPIAADYVVGAELTPNQFEALTPRDVGDGRIVERVLVGDGDRVVARGYAWVDTELGVAVHPESIDGARYALVPASAGLPLSGRYFSDSACTQERLFAEVPAQACAGLPPARHLVVSAATLPGCTPPQVTSLGAAANRAQLYDLTTGVCARLTASDTELRPAGAAVELAAFVSATAAAD